MMNKHIVIISEHTQKGVAPTTYELLGLAQAIREIHPFEVNVVLLGADPEELALKFLGVGLLYGANEEVKKISLAKSKEGKVLFTVDARGQYQLPPPPAQLADRIFSIVRSITHIEEDRGSQPLSLGLRNDRMEITMQLNRQGESETLTLLFPQS